MSTPKYSWSYSALNMFETCPRKYEIIRVKKLVKDPPGKAAEEGTLYHTLIEEYLRDDKWDSRLLPYKRLLSIVKEKDGKCEEGYHFKRDLTRCEPDDPDCWVRSYLDWSKIDGTTAEIIDWKTGKVKPSKQLSFYAWLMFVAHPELEKVKVTFHWINRADQLSEWYDRKDMERLFKPFSDTLQQLEYCFESDIWPEMPNDFCKWCVVTKEHCSYGN